MAPALLLALALALLLAASPAKAAPPLLEIPLRVLVARCAGELVRPAAWVEEHVGRANAVLAPHAVRLEARVEPLELTRCDLVTRAHRHGLAPHVRSGEVTVIVVRSIQDLDVPSYRLMGVHWRYRGAERSLHGRRWVYLTARARPPVLAHELAHFFGLRHDPAGGNLMTPGPSDPAWRGPGPGPKPFRPVLTRTQARRLRSRARRFARAPSVEGGAPAQRPAPPPGTAP